MTGVEEVDDSIEVLLGGVGQHQLHPISTNQTLKCHFPQHASKAFQTHHLPAFEAVKNGCRAQHRLPLFLSVDSIIFRLKHFDTMQHTKGKIERLPKSLGPEIPIAS